MKLVIGQHFKSNDTGNMLTIKDVRGDRLMVASSAGDESIHAVCLFEAAITDGTYIEIEAPVTLSRKAKTAIKKYTMRVCKRAYEMCENEGNGARTIAYDFDMTTRQADSAINAYREFNSIPVINKNDQSLFTAEKLKSVIKSVYAVELKNGFRIDAELTDGSVIVLKKKSNRKPAMVQLYSSHVNGNCRDDKSPSRFFTFSKTIDNTWTYIKHLKTFIVE